MTSATMKPNSPKHFNCQLESDLFVSQRMTRKSTSKPVLNSLDLQDDNSYATPIPQQKKRNHANTNSTIPEWGKSTSTRNKKLMKSPKFSNKNMTLLFGQDQPNGVEEFGQISNSKLYQQIVSRRNQVTPSIQNEDQHTSSLHSLNVIRKKKSNFMESNFSYRKSYRKALVRKQRDFVPYRRQQDLLQGKIIIHGRICNKQLQTLSEKMIKLSSKELLNKFIVSGFKKIVELVKVVDQNYQESFVEKLQETENKLRIMIEDELDNSQQYFQEQQNQEKIQPKNIENYMVRKIYSLLREKKNQGSLEKLQFQAIEIYENFAQQDEEIKRKNIIKLLQNVNQKDIKN